MDLFSIIKQENWIDILIGEKVWLEVPYIWLFDNQAGHFHLNGQKLVETTDMDLAVKPYDIFLSDNKLMVEWAKDDLLMEYDLETLGSIFSYKWTPPQATWTRDDLKEVILRWDYQTIKEEEEPFLEFLEAVITYGFAILENVPTIPNTIFDVVDLFGYVRETNYGKLFDVVAKPDPNNLAYTADGLPPHTDNPYRDPVPTLQLLHCLKADSEGGESLLLDGFKIAEELEQTNEQYFELLATEPILYRFRDAHTLLENRTTVIGLNADGFLHHIRFNNRSIQPFVMGPKRMANYYKAYQAFEQQIRNERYIYQFKLKPGELVLFDNERILHGRTSYTLKGERHLQGCYADRDSLYSKWRILLQKYY